NIGAAFWTALSTIAGIAYQNIIPIFREGYDRLDWVILEPVDECNFGVQYKPILNFSKKKYSPSVFLSQYHEYIHEYQENHTSLVSCF
ncbi:hypothetical protein ACJX0J_035887, partial [Zea mays]